MGFDSSGSTTTSLCLQTFGLRQLIYALKTFGILTFGLQLHLGVGL